MGKSTNHAELNQMPPSLPGMMLHVSIPKKLCVCRDGWELPQNKELWEQVKAHVEKYSARLECGTKLEPAVVYGEPSPGNVVRKIDDGIIKTWLYWMRRLVDNNLAKVVSGVLPTLDEIATLPGKTRISQFNSDTKRRMHVEDFDAQGDWVGLKPGESERPQLAMAGAGQQSSGQGGGQSGNPNRGGGNQGNQGKNQN